MNVGLFWLLLFVLIIVFIENDETVFFFFYRAYINKENSRIAWILCVLNIGINIIILGLLHISCALISPPGEKTGNDILGESPCNDSVKNTHREIIHNTPCRKT